MEKKVTRIFLTLFLLIGLYIRISGTLSGYFAFTFDQGRDFLALRNLVYNKDLSLIGPPTGIDGVFHGVWWHWFLAAIFWNWKGDPTFVVATFNFLSTFSILIAYYLGKIIKDYKLGIINAGVVAVSPFFVGTSAQLWHPNMVPILMLFLVLALWQFLRKKWHYFWIAIILGLIFEFEFGFGGLFLPAFFITSVIFRVLPSKKGILLAILGFGFWLTPRIIFELRNNFIQTKSLVRYIQNPQISQFQMPLFLRFADRIKTLFFIFKDAYAFGNEFFGVVLLILILIFLLVLYKTPKETEVKKLLTFILTLILFIQVGASIYPNALWNYYLIGVPSLMLPIVGLIFYKAIERFRSLGWIWFGAWFLYSWSPWSLINQPVWEGDASVYKNQLAVVSSIYEQAENQPFNVQVYSPSVIDYTYNYLFVWYGNKKYGYSPDRENIQTLAFFIIEPEKWNPKLREAWLRERIGDGRIVWKNEFLGGIEVEKRIR